MERDIGIECRHEYTIHVRYKRLWDVAGVDVLRVTWLSLLLLVGKVTE